MKTPTSPDSPSPSAGGESSASDEVLERNVGTLLANAGEPPRLSSAARARIRAHLLATAGAEAPRRSSRVLAWAGAAALATAGVTALVVAGRSPSASPSYAAGSHRLADGSVAELAAGAELVVLGPRRVRVHGAAVLDVVPGAGRFVVETATGTVEALGTRFWVQASDQATDAAVLRGQIALRARGEQASGEVVLGAGEGGRVDQSGPPRRQSVPRLSHLTSWVKALRDDKEAAPMAARRGTLYARDPNFPDSGETPLPMKQLTVDVVLDQRVARVAIDHTFHNASDAVREGMYRFAIPPDAALQRLSMYVGGVLMESAVVERMRARRVYEDLVLRRVDPALLEHDGPGKLALRVYPLAPREDKRLALAYTQSLPRLYDTWSLTVPLPKIDQPVDDVRFVLRLADCATCEVSSPSHQLAVTRKGEGVELTYHGTSVVPGDSLVLHVRERRTGATAARYRDGADDYYLLRVPGELPTKPPAAKRRHWMILQDASASRGPLERRAQAELVSALVREFDEQDQVAITSFDLTPHPLLPFRRVQDVDPAVLASTLRDAPGGIGATDLGRALDAAVEALRAAGATEPMIVYLGDGVATAGERRLDGLRARIAGKATFIGLAIGDGADPSLLGGLAAATGGLVTTFDLSDDLRWRAFDLVATLHTARVTGVAATLLDPAGRPLEGALLRAPQLAEGEEVELLAKLPSGTELAAIELTGQLDGAPWRQRLALGAATWARGNTGYVPRLWAQREIDRLLMAKHEPVIAPPCNTASCPETRELREARDEGLRKQIVALGTRFFLLSRHTSLLVLENDAMYAQYGVTKGRGQTWAPYELPARLPVPPKPAPPQAPAAPSGSELTRAPWSSFGELLGLLDTPASLRASTPWAAYRYRGLRDLSSRAGHFEHRLNDDVFVDRDSGDEAAQTGVEEKAELAKSSMNADKEMAPLADLASQAAAVSPSESVAFGRLGGLARRSSRGYGPGLPLAHLWSGGWPRDLSALVPALSLDELERTRRALRHLAPEVVAVDQGVPPDVDAAAAALLREAAAALPAGRYQWGSLELSLDGKRRLGWRRTLPSGLQETAGFDGTRLVRHYPELDVAATRALAIGDELAVAFSVFPLWIAPVESYARRFRVALHGDEVSLTPRGAAPTAAPALVLVFERRHLRQVRDGFGRVLLEVTWQGDQPIAARLQGQAIAVRFEPDRLEDASVAHLAGAPSVQLELPVRTPARRAEELAREPAGSAAWRQRTHQLLASLFVVGDPAGLADTLRTLSAHGPLTPGELVLCSAAMPELPPAQSARLLESPHPVAQTLRLLLERFARERGRRGRVPPPSAPPALGGVLGALLETLYTSDLVKAGKLELALERAEQLAPEATAWRLIAASELLGALPRSKVEPERLLPLLDSLGPRLRNEARWQIAAAYLARPGAAASRTGNERLAELLPTMELTAPPPSFELPLWYQLTERGSAPARWDLVYPRWRDRVLAQGDLAHVLLLAAETPHDREPDVLRALTRAVELAGRDQRALAEVAELAISRQLSTWAWSVLRPLLDAPMSPELARLASLTAQLSSQPAEALRALELAVRASLDDSYTASAAFADFHQLLRLAAEAALRESGARRAELVQKAEELAALWRSLDGSAPVDRPLAQVYFAIGQPAEALRLLSSAVDRDPMSGPVWGELAGQVQGAGLVEESVALWHEALILDQTNPIWRLRKAQALRALGRKQEAREVLRQVAARRWNVRWEWEVQEARALLREVERDQ